MKNIVILGSTGSIGRSSLEVISKFPDRFRATGLTAGKNSSLLAEQIKEFKPSVVAVPDEETYKNLKSQISNLGSRSKTEIICGAEGIISVAEMSGADTVISSIVGSAGLLPTLAAIKKGRTVALANKETLVTAGDIVISQVKKHKAVLLPVDSEHSAIFQCIHGYDKGSIKRLILTASGGPFAGRTIRELENVSPSDALKHPNWSMGKKITIDSATLMNKGLEMIEARWLFDMQPEKIDVLVHPQSIIHSIVEFDDCGCLAQMSRPDMKGPIAYALSYPERLCNVMEPLDWEKLSGLTFFKPDKNTFRCLPLAYSAIKTGGTMPAALNAANEVAVSAFLDGIVSFNGIPVIIEKVMDLHAPMPADNIEEILEADRWAREKTMEEINK
jgi:1-deoxy-D-xylulose-5-phosphate reductoisomerase